MNCEPHGVGIDSRLRGEMTEEALLQCWEPLARYLAGRFTGALEREDLEQVARLAVLRAARRFDPTLGWQFSTFAAATIVGDLRHYLRDRGPAIRVPRRWWELRPRLEQTRERLAQALGREPTNLELATRLVVSEEDVAGALGLKEICYPRPLDELRTTPEGDEPESLAGMIGGADPRLEALEQRIAVLQAMEALPARLREILQRRYFQGRSQQQVGRELGVSQMQISRLERRALAQLRDALCDFIV